MQTQKNRKPASYIGITGFKTIKEVLKAASLFKNRQNNCKNNCNYNNYCDDYTCGCKDSIVPHKQMFGFIVSDKRLQDPNSEGTQSPALKHLDDLIACATAMSEIHNDFCIPMIHYYTPNRNKLSEEISQVFMSIYEQCKSVQINIAWPDIQQIEKIKQEFPEMDIVLQLNKEAMDKAQGQELIQRVKEYEKLVEYILIDPSGGKGVEFNVEECARIMIELIDAFHGKHFCEFIDAPHGKHIGIAGGFDGDNVEQRVRQIYEQMVTPEVLRQPNFCIDAQGKLRTDNKESIDITKMKKYIDKATFAFRKAQHYYDEEYFDRR